MRILTPPEIVKIKEPIIFLAGPIQGAPDWQSEVIKYFYKKNNVGIIANPRRERFDQSFNFEKQIDWESYYLKYASKKGIIMFWLEKEAHHDCLRAYGQTSRFELGEWIHQGKKRGHHLIVGIHDNFPGKKYLKYRIEKDFPYVQVLNDIDHVCEYGSQTYNFLFH